MALKDSTIVLGNVFDPEQGSNKYTGQLDLHSHGFKIKTIFTHCQHRD